MKAKLIFCFVLGLFIFTCCGSKKSSDKKETVKKYQENWASLSKYNESPDWFRDAKFGIYFHWGVYSVPAF